MDELQENKHEIRSQILEILKGFSEETHSAKTRAIEQRLFTFANFLEAAIALLYIPIGRQVSTRAIIERALKYDKIVALPAFKPGDFNMTLYKVDSLASDLVDGPRKIPQPDPARCKVVPLQRIDIAIVPGIAFDTKGGRIGTGRGYYDRLIPKLPATTRKVSIAFEEQIVPQVPMEAHDRYVDIIITEKRIIYKI